ncbi:ATP-binding protein [Haloarcula litorea]|uniref:ATP-binding protein n=1 Tax=Haloarcula litorea TaxID=3032579 RepID=UPI0023E8952E|nr:PAS domain-containing sensor histidine kinase [Halomicroarcula sp. GDY20]
MSDRQELGVGAVVAVVGLAVAGLAAVDVYVDAVQQGDPLWTTALENTLSLGVAAALVGTAAWLWTRATERQARRMGAWAGVAVAAVGLTALLVLGSQSLQSRFKPIPLATTIAGLTVVAGLLVGWYDAARLDSMRIVKRERDKFAALFENVPNPVIGVKFVGEEVHVEMVNPAFEEVFDHSASDLAGRDLRTVLRPPGEEPERVDGGVRSGRSHPPSDDDDGGEWTETAITLETAYGQREFVRVTAPAQQAPDTEEYAYYVDVTDRKQRRERLQVLSRTLRHDIRNRMDVAHGTAEVLEAELDDEQESLARQIQTAVTDLQRISEQTREVEHVVSGEYDAHPADLSATVTECVAAVRTAHPTASISVELPDLPAVRATDGLAVAVENVLENAIEHNDSEEPAVEVTASVTDDGDYVALRVADDGPGIPDREIELLQGERDRTQLEHTSGLGLWEATWVLRDLGGAIEFADGRPRGTVVTIRIPVAEEHE